MTSKIYKKLFGMLAICLIAIVTGVAVGKIFVDSSAGAQSVSGTYADYQDSESQITALYERSKNGASALSFNAVELFEIAEYRLYHADQYYSVMCGTVDTMMVQAQSTEAVWKDGKLVVNKLSPGSVVLGIDTNVHSQTIYDSNTGAISVNKNGSFTEERTYGKTKNLSDENFVPMKARFVESSAVAYTMEEYEAVFAKKPTMTIPYVISNLICGGDSKNFGGAKSNGDGTYSFELNISGAYLYASAIYYSKDIESSSGSAPIWKNLNIKVTIDSNFRFKQIVYTETYKVKKMGMLVSIVDDFMQRFEYDNVPSVEEVM